MAVDHPWMLWLAPLVLIPWRWSPWAPRVYAWTGLLPADSASRWLDLGLRAVGSAALASLLLGLSGLHLAESTREQIGDGADLVLLLDRSRSMDDSFAGRPPSGDEESKSAAAQRLLSDFVSRRRHDRIGVAAFSTAPLFVLPLTSHRDAVLAAVHAMKQPGLAQTHVGKGLAMALSYFDQAPVDATSRIVLLVSDGAAAIDPDSEKNLRAWFVDRQVHLFWIFLRTKGSQGLFEASVDPSDDTPLARPERYLHLFFTGLGIPYRAYEAENEAAMQAAIDDIDRSNRRPRTYSEIIPRRELQTGCFLIASLGIGGLIWAKFQEVRAA